MICVISAENVGPLLQMFLSRTTYEAKPIPYTDTKPVKTFLPETFLGFCGNDIRSRRYSKQ